MSSSSIFTINRWLVTVFTVLMVVTAALAGNGIFQKGSSPWLITGHMHLGNLLFVLAVAQMVICYVLFTRKILNTGTMLASFLVFVFTFGQIGLGFSTRSHMVALVGWHIALGVALTAALAMLATMLWMTARAAGGVTNAG